jgi:single-strand DNA-binding protein|uniref:Single-stranded DNA-binding protein n=1 Tax=Siphoviridae sp. ctMYJ33 TaxID=2825461 RepID=A0A8S5PB27_9CAUD|nr:MAG TPA: Single strand binding protein [Siphoviridae sp. ctMYJ33]
MNNNFFFIGRLTRNPELRYTSSNKAVTQIDLAIANTKDDTTFVQITLFEKMAENVCKYCEKGDLIGFQGSVKNHNWEDSKGVKHYDYTFMANRMSFLQTKPNNQAEQKKPEMTEKKSTDEQIYADFGDAIEIDESDIAF